MRDVIAVEADDVVGDDAAEQLLDERLQLRIHLFQLGDEIGEELCHVLLLAGVQRLLVHRVDFAKVLWVVSFALGGGEKGEEFLRRWRRRRGRRRRSKRRRKKPGDKKILTLA